MCHISNCLSSLSVRLTMPLLTCFKPWLLLFYVTLLKVMLFPLTDLLYITNISMSAWFEISSYYRYLGLNVASGHNTPFFVNSWPVQKYGTFLFGKLLLYTPRTLYSKVLPLNFVNVVPCVTKRNRILDNFTLELTVFKQHYLMTTKSLCYRPYKWNHISYLKIFTVYLKLLKDYSNSLY